MRGSILQKKGREGKGHPWYIILDVTDEDGKRKRKWFSGYKSKREAEKALPDLIKEIEGGAHAAKSTTMGSFMTQWLEDKKPAIRYNTWKKYDWLIRIHIVPSLGKHALDKLKPAHLQAFYAKLSTDADLSARSILHTHRLLYLALSTAVKWGLVTRNIAMAVEPPKPERFEPNVWTMEQAMAFLEYTNANEPRYYVVYSLAIMTGMRKTEITGLKWSDIDWEHGVVTVQRSLDYVHKEPIVKEVKTAGGRRNVTLPSLVLEALAHQRQLQEKDRQTFKSVYRVDDWVCTNELGYPMSPYSVTTSWYRALEAANAPRIRFHDLRHTHASLLLSQGVHPKIVSERLGHSNIQITLDTYSHLLPNVQAEASAAFDAAMRATKK